MVMRSYLIISFLFYLPIALYIVLVVGWQLYKNGCVYILTFFSEDEVLADKLNNLLLIGFYLINLGFALLAILIWPSVDNLAEAILAALNMFGKLCLLLGILHVNNKACIAIYAFRKHLFHYKKQ